MGYSITNKLLGGACQIESPNQSDRSRAGTIDLLIIHNISLPPGEYGNGCIDQFFCNQLDTNAHAFFANIADLEVSAHLLIDRNGKVTQYVPFDRKAWHAGESVYNGRPDCNDYSIGIELEGSDFEAFTDLQYRTLIGITNLLMDDYPCLNSNRVVGHSDVSPGRKTDPGPYFDWNRYKAAINLISNKGS